jgi:hypothetical protein
MTSTFSLLKFNVGLIIDKKLTATLDEIYPAKNSTEVVS